MVIERCTGSWGTQILNGTKKSLKKCQLGKVPVGGSASWKRCQLGEVPVVGSASWGKYQLGEVLVRGSASWGTSASFGTKI